ncbi:hypothetical protein I5J93_06595 [Pseudomonas aeruginosa]|uniref:hypothetical protein n=1 Tax=Pseudomonas aeruginosa TaxID=287 RepID=UPI001067EC51|nr:hypothetical protein [Pseudomonas aeruginosa]MBH8860478.1 hypothetical protein [Pseudomonas aeruginosa]MDG4470985.1 hypothetical protein [Pseudomonas aeruginosa]TEQ25177.1 hypothetical protein IPC58_12215 [Pseudomonas aeruginosa]HDY6077250.1 hypothetical protein [Pseudomonas aeruginosa]HEP9026054.1 hypothetical protein [Pseudomonas aeruginosa]
MIAGLQIFNDCNTIQFDDNYHAPILISKSTVSVRQRRPAPYDAGSFGALEVFAKDPLLFMGNTYGGAVTVSSREEVYSGFWRFTLVADSFSGTDADVYVFDNAPPQSSGFGLQIYKPDGITLGFDSGSKYLRLSDVLQASSGITSSFSLPSGRQYAAMLSYSRTDIVDGPSEPFQSWFTRREGLSISASSVATSFVAVFKFPSSRSSMRQPGAVAPQVVLADITDY